MGDTPYLIVGGSDRDYHPIGGILCSPALEAEKSADRSEAKVGEWINYTVQVNNTGNVSLTGVRAEDNLTGAVWNVGTLAPGQNYTNTIRYRVLLSDLPGPLVNELWANGTDPCGSEVNDSAMETVNITGQSLTCIDGYKLDTLGNVLEGWKIFVDQNNNSILDPGEPSNITDSSGYWQICGLNVSSTVNVTEGSQPGWSPSLPPEGWQTVTVQPNNGTGYINFTNQIVSCTGVPKTITVCASGCNCTSIQADINAACPGDAIEVQSGTYHENVNVNKQLTLQGKDTGSGLPVVDAGGSGNAITLSANNCTLKDFVAMNSSSGHSGIRVTSSSNTISGNTATGNYYGIYLQSSSGNTISGNTATGNSVGIRLTSSSNGNTITGNTANGNSVVGIDLFSSGSNTITGNTATGNLEGIFLFTSSNNTVSGNTATGNTFGIYLTSSSNGNTITGNTATSNSVGIRLTSSSNGNTITGNTATGNTESGIVLDSSSNSTVSGNTATGNSVGIRLTSSSNGNTITGNTANGNGHTGIYLEYNCNSNTITGNIVTGNTYYGIILVSSSGNIIYLNTLDSGWSNGANNWNSTTEIDYGDSTTYVGNNWSGYDGFDCNGDGIGETPYPVAGGSDIDYHPIGGIPCSTCISGYKLNGCGEPLEGWTIFVDKNRNGTLDSGEPANVTDASGYWQICDLVSGAEVRVAEQAKAGWRASQPSTGWQEITVQPDNGTSYVNFTNIQLLCISGYKLDQSGLPLEDWNITLANGSYTSTATTDSAGKYEFCGLEPGDYDLSEELQEGWAAVSAPDEVELNCTNVTEQNFVNRRLLCINGTKINNCTGEGIEGWSIKLYSEFGLEMNSTTTDKNGDYTFCNLEPGNYTVCEFLQGGWKNVTARCIEVVLDTGNSEDNDFLNTPPVCISGSKINDGTDQGIPGWKMNLYDAAGNVIDDTVTDANGRYSFCNLTPGIYYVCEEKREGWIPVREDRRTSVPSNGISQTATCNMPWCDDNCVCVDLDCDGAEVNFRNIQESLCINGSIINNCTDAGLVGWKVYLYDATGKNIFTTSTDRNGHFSFCGLLPGQYRICEEIKAGYVPVTYINQSPASCTPEDCTCDVCNNCIPVILDCENSDGNIFQNIPPLSIKGKVIDDCTGDGLPGWTVKLYDGATSLTTRTTGNDGSFTFTSSTTSGGLKLTAGKLYTVCEVVQNGYTPVNYHANNNSPPMSNEYCVPVFLDCGETELEDFENIPPLIISGHEFNQCTGAGLDGWSVHLKDGAGNILETTTTDESGYYEFRGRQPGWYTVCEDSIPEGWTSVREDPNSPAMAQPGTSAAPADCETPKCIVVNLDYCEDATDNDFYNIPPFCIKGNVNSTTDDALPANFQVKIENSDGTQIESVPIDENGDYSSCDLKAGTYTVCVNTPGWTADEPCVVVYLDCMDEEHDFAVYKGRNPMVPGIAQPAISLDDSRGAVVPGEMSEEPSASEKNMRGDEPPAARPSTNPEII